MARRRLLSDIWVSNNNLNFNEYGGTEYISIECSGEWVVKSKPAWINISESYVELGGSIIPFSGGSTALGYIDENTFAEDTRITMKVHYVLEKLGPTIMTGSFQIPAWSTTLNYQGVSGSKSESYTFKTVTIPASATSITIPIIRGEVKISSTQGEWRDSGYQMMLQMESGKIYNSISASDDYVQEGDRWYEGGDKRSLSGNNEQTSIEIKVNCYAAFDDTHESREGTTEVYFEVPKQTITYTYLVD